MAIHNQFSSPEQKVEWLLQHRNFLVGVARKKLIVADMKRDELVSKATL